MFNESISLGRLFQSLAAENWNVLWPAADFTLGRWSSVLSLKCLIRLLERVGKYDYTNGSGYVTLFTILKINWKRKNVYDCIMSVNLICYACPANKLFCRLWVAIILIAWFWSLSSFSDMPLLQLSQTMPTIVENRQYGLFVDVQQRLSR